MSAKFGGSSRLYQRTTPPFTASASCGMLVHYLPGTIGTNQIIASVNEVASTTCVRVHHTGTSSTLGYTNRAVSDAGQSTIASALTNGRWHSIVASQTGNSARRLVGRPETAGRFADGTSATSSFPSGFTGVSLGGRDTTDAVNAISANSYIAHAVFFNRGLTQGEQYRLASGEWPSDVVETDALAQWYPLDRDFRCVITGLEMTVEGTVTLDARRPRYLDRGSRRRIGWTPALVSGGGGSTGTLAASESGSDTFASAGAVVVQGALSTTEVGADTAAATGAVLVQGTLAATEAGADTFSATGTTTGGITGTLAATESGADSFASTGAVKVQGPLAASEGGSDALAATGTVSGGTITGAMAAAESGNDTFAAASSAPRVIVGFTIVADGGIRIAALDGIIIT